MKEYKKLLLNNLNRFDIKIISYCIMNNHSHILIYTENIEEMSNYMKSVNTSYAGYYNRNIHNNPIKAKMVNSVEKYKYSSYNDYIKKQGTVNEETIKLVFCSTKDYL